MRRNTKGPSSHTTDSIHDDLLEIVGNTVAAMKAKELDADDIDSLDKLNRIWTSLKKEERENAREALVDELKQNKWEALLPQAIDYLQKKSGT